MVGPPWWFGGGSSGGGWRRVGCLWGWRRDFVGLYKRQKKMEE